MKAYVIQPRKSPNPLNSHVNNTLYHEFMRFYERLNKYGLITFDNGVEVRTSQHGTIYESVIVDKLDSHCKWIYPTSQGLGLWDAILIDLLFQKESIAGLGPLFSEVSKIIGFTLSPMILSENYHVDQFPAIYPVRHYHNKTIEYRSTVYGGQEPIEATRCDPSSFTMWIPLPPSSNRAEREDGWGDIPGVARFTSIVKKIALNHPDIEYINRMKITPDSRFAVDMIISFGDLESADGYGFDLDNRIKFAQDAVFKLLPQADDSAVDALSAKRGSAKAGIQITITIL